MYDLQQYLQNESIKRQNLTERSLSPISMKSRNYGVKDFFVFRLCLYCLADTNSSKIPSKLSVSLHKIYRL